MSAAEKLIFLEARKAAIAELGERVKAAELPLGATHVSPVIKRTGNILRYLTTQISTAREGAEAERNSAAAQAEEPFDVEATMRFIDGLPSIEEVADALDSRLRAVAAACGTVHEFMAAVTAVRQEWASVAGLKKAALGQGLDAAVHALATDVSARLERETFEADTARLVTAVSSSPAAAVEFWERRLVAASELVDQFPESEDVKALVARTAARRDAARADLVAAVARDAEQEAIVSAAFSAAKQALVRLAGSAVSLDDLAEQSSAPMSDFERVSGDAGVRGAELAALREAAAQLVAVRMVCSAADEASTVEHARAKLADAQELLTSLSAAHLPAELGDELITVLRTLRGHVTHLESLMDAAVGAAALQTKRDAIAASKLALAVDVAALKTRIAEAVATAVSMDDFSSLRSSLELEFSDAAIRATSAITAAGGKPAAAAEIVEEAHRELDADLSAAQAAVQARLRVVDFLKRWTVALAADAPTLTKFGMLKNRQVEATALSRQLGGKFGLAQIAAEAAEAVRVAKSELDWSSLATGIAAQVDRAIARPAAQSQAEADATRQVWTELLSQIEVLVAERTGKASKGLRTRAAAAKMDAEEKWIEAKPARRVRARHVPVVDVEALQRAERLARFEAAVAGLEAQLAETTVGSLAERFGVVRALTAGVAAIADDVEGVPEAFSGRLATLGDAVTARGRALETAQSEAELTSTSFLQTLLTKFVAKTAVADAAGVDRAVKVVLAKMSERSTDCGGRVAMEDLRVACVEPMRMVKAQVLPLVDAVVRIARLGERIEQIHSSIHASLEGKSEEERLAVLRESHAEIAAALEEVNRDPAFMQLPTHVSRVHARAAQKLDVLRAWIRRQEIRVRDVPVARAPGTAVSLEDVDAVARDIMGLPTAEAELARLSVSVSDSAKSCKSMQALEKKIHSVRQVWDKVGAKNKAEMSRRLNAVIRDATALATARMAVSAFEALVPAAQAAAAQGLESQAAFWTHKVEEALALSGELNHHPVVEALVATLRERAAAAVAAHTLAVQEAEERAAIVLAAERETARVEAEQREIVSRLTAELVREIGVAARDVGSVFEFDGAFDQIQLRMRAAGGDMGHLVALAAQARVLVELRSDAVAFAARMALHAPAVADEAVAFFAERVEEATAQAERLPETALELAEVSLQVRSILGENIVIAKTRLVAARDQAILDHRAQVVAEQTEAFGRQAATWRDALMAAGDAETLQLVERQVIANWSAARAGLATALNEAGVSDSHSAAIQTRVGSPVIAAIREARALMQGRMRVAAFEAEWADKESAARASNSEPQIIEVHVSKIAAARALVEAVGEALGGPALETATATVEAFKAGVDWRNVASVLERKIAVLETNTAVTSGDEISRIKAECAAVKSDLALLKKHGGVNVKHLLTRVNAAELAAVDSWINYDPEAVAREAARVRDAAARAQQSRIDRARAAEQREARKMQQEAARVEADRAAAERRSEELREREQRRRVAEEAALANQRQTEERLAREAAEALERQATEAEQQRVRLEQERAEAAAERAARISTLMEPIQQIRAGFEAACASSDMTNEFVVIQVYEGFKSRMTAVRRNIARDVPAEVRAAADGLLAELTITEARAMQIAGDAERRRSARLAEMKKQIVTLAINLNSKAAFDSAVAEMETADADMAALIVAARDLVSVRQEVVSMRALKPTSRRDAKYLGVAANTLKSLTPVQAAVPKALRGVARSLAGEIDEFVRRIERVRAEVLEADRLEQTRKLDEEAARQRLLEAEAAQAALRVPVTGSGEEVHGQLVLGRFGQRVRRSPRIYVADEAAGVIRGIHSRLLEALLRAVSVAAPPVSRDALAIVHGLETGAPRAHQAAAELIASLVQPITGSGALISLPVDLFGSANGEGMAGRRTSEFASAEVEAFVADLRLIASVPGIFDDRVILLEIVRFAVNEAIKLRDNLMSASENEVLDAEWLVERLMACERALLPRSRSSDSVDVLDEDDSLVASRSASHVDALLASRSASHVPLPANVLRELLRPAPRMPFPFAVPSSRLGNPRMIMNGNAVVGDAHTAAAPAPASASDEMAAIATRLAAIDAEKFISSERSNELMHEVDSLSVRLDQLRVPTADRRRANALRQRMSDVYSTKGSEYVDGVAFSRGSKKVKETTVKAKGPTKKRVKSKGSGDKKPEGSPSVESADQDDTIVESPHDNVAVDDGGEWTTVLSDAERRSQRAQRSMGARAEEEERQRQAAVVVPLEESEAEGDPVPDVRQAGREAERTTNRLRDGFVSRVRAAGSSAGSPRELETGIAAVRADLALAGLEEEARIRVAADVEAAAVRVLTSFGRQAIAGFNARFSEIQRTEADRLQNPVQALDHATLKLREARALHTSLERFPEVVRQQVQELIANLEARLERARRASDSFIAGLDKPTRTRTHRPRASRRHASDADEEPSHVGVVAPVTTVAISGHRAADRHETNMFVADEAAHVVRGFNSRFLQALLRAVSRAAPPVSRDARAIAHGLAIGAPSAQQAVVEFISSLVQPVTGSGALVSLPADLFGSADREEPAFASAEVEAFVADLRLLAAVPGILDDKVILLEIVRFAMNEAIMLRDNLMSASEDEVLDAEWLVERLMACERALLPRSRSSDADDVLDEVDSLVSSRSASHVEALLASRSASH
ncbi:MAG: hypothetical protein F2923_05740, partial [Actinobacteria bacterium]|nr:hypothetical protein [Actinomycetota bacterium]